MGLKNLLNFKAGKTKEKSGSEAPPASDALKAQITELINDRSKELEAAKQQINNLGNAAVDTKKNEEATPQPHGPLVELSIEPEDKEKEEETEVNISVGKAEEGVKLVEVEPQETIKPTKLEIKTIPASPAGAKTAEGNAGAAPAPSEPKMVEVKAKAPPPAEAKVAEVKKAKTEASADDSLHNLFSQDEEEANPLANLIGSLPDVTIQELLDDLQELKVIIHDTQSK